MLTNLFSTEICFFFVCFSLRRPAHPQYSEFCSKQQESCELNFGNKILSAKNAELAENWKLDKSKIMRCGSDDVACFLSKLAHLVNYLS